MRTLPVAIFTHNRTKVACAVVNSLLDHLKCPGWRIRYIVCDDLSRPGHVDELVKAFTDRGVEPSVHLNDEKRHGLGASMNKGLEDAFDTSRVCLRTEDDWLLKRDLDISDWANVMDKMSIGSIRLGMLFRFPDELVPIGHGLLKVKSRPKRRMTMNNQIALVTDALYDVCGRAYPENVAPNVVERTMADAYSEATDNGHLTPWTCWPEGWETRSYRGPNMAFEHIGASTLGHDCYPVPPQYLHLQDNRDRPVPAIGRRMVKSVAGKCPEPIT